MGKVDRELGRELRLRRIAGGDTLGSLAGKCRVSEKTIGKWERGETMPSATNIRMLEKFGLIQDWLGRNGGKRQYPQGARQGGNGRIARTSQHPEPERQSWGEGIEDACERELIAAFRTFAADERNTIVEVLQLVLAKLHSDS